MGPIPPPAAAPVLGHLGGGAAEGAGAGESQALRAVRWGDRGEGATLLPVDRGQDREVPGGGTAPDLSRAGGTRHTRGVRERPLHLPPARRAAPDAPDPAGAGAGADDENGLRDRVRLLPTPPAAPDPGEIGRASCRERR